MIRPLKDGRVKVTGKSDKEEMGAINEQLLAEIQILEDGYVGYADKPVIEVRHSS